LQGAFLPDKKKKNREKLSSMSFASFVVLKYRKRRFEGEEVQWKYSRK
jgi:hypothetical protein